LQLLCFPNDRKVGHHLWPFFSHELSELLMWVHRFQEQIKVEDDLTDVDSTSLDLLSQAMFSVDFDLVQHGDAHSNDIPYNDAAVLQIYRGILRDQ
jgi:hypothetical protein